MSKINSMWIDGDDLSVGQTGFLVQILNETRRSERIEMRDRPPRTNQSHAYRPNGWCGSSNDVSTYGLGVWTVTRVAKNGRAQVARVTDRDALEKFLDEYGFPDLLDECLEAIAA